MIYQLSPHSSGKHFKLRIEDVPDQAWTTIVGDKKETDLLQAVTRRCINYRANSIASLPFIVTNLSGEELLIEEQADFSVGVTKLIDSLRQIEISMIFTSEAFYHVDDQRILDPRTISPVYDREYGITSFKRGGTTIELDKILYFCDKFIDEQKPAPSIYSSVLPAQNVLLSIDEYISQFFDNGTIKATILHVEGFPTEEERARLNNFLSRSIKGLKNAFNSVVMRVPIQSTVVGSGLEDLDEELIRVKQHEIVQAFEIPAGLIFSEEPNYATAQVERRAFLESAIIPRAEFLFGVMNKYLKQFDLQLLLTPESMSEFQEDENQRSAALLTMVQSGVRLIDALEMLGYELSEEQTAYYANIDDMQNEQTQLNGLLTNGTIPLG